MWGGSGAVYKARGAEDPLSRLLPPWAVTSVTWSGLLCSPPIKSSVSSPGSSPLRTGTRVCHPGCAPPGCHPSFYPGPWENASVLLIHGLLCSLALHSRPASLAA